MQNVRLNKASSENQPSTHYFSSQQYSKPMAKKQFAQRVEQYNSSTNDEWENSSKTTSTYYSNIDNGN